MKKYSFLFKFQITLSLVLIIFISSSQAQTLNNLFTSSSQRANLDQLRSDYLAQTAAENFDIIEAIAAEVEVEEEPDVAKPITEFHLSAIMSPNNKERTVWLNNASLYESELPSNISITNIGNGLALLIKTANNDFILKPGQTISTETGDLVESASKIEPLDDAAPDNSSQEIDSLIDDEADVSPAIIAESELIPSPGSTILDNLDPSKLDGPEVIQALQVLQEAMND